MDAEKVEKKLNGYHYPSMIVPTEGRRARFEELSPFTSGFC